MAISTKDRVMNGGIIFLVIVNVTVLGILGTLFFKRPPAPAPAQRYLQDELHLAEAQIQRVEELKRLYQGKMKPLDDDIRTLKEAMLEEVFAAAPDTQKADQLAADIGVRQAELERLRFQHFLALKSLFQPEQTEKFRSLIQDIFRPPAPPESEKPPEPSRPPRPDESPDRKRPPDRREPPEQRKPPRSDEPPGDRRSEG